MRNQMGGKRKNARPAKFAERADQRGEHEPSDGAEHSVLAVHPDADSTREVLCVHELGEV